MPPKCQAYLVVDASPSGPAPAELARALQLAQIACVLLQPGAAERTDTERLPALVKAVQSQNAAALVAEDAALAVALAADGVHLAHDPDDEAALAKFKAARALLGPNRIVGAGSGFGRHQAMALAESGADYVAFGDSDGDEVDVAARLDLIAWWAEMFVVPCVAWAVASPAEAAELARAGADFVATGPTGGLSDALAMLGGLNSTAMARV